MKKLLFISRQAPYGSARAREALDAVLAASAYGQELSLLFMDDGVLQLLDRQGSEAVEQKNLARQLAALPLYGVTPIYVHQESLALRGIDPQCLAPDELQLLTSAQVQALIAGQDQLLSF